MSNEHPAPMPHEFHIQIDRVHYTVTKPEMKGAELRQLPPTPIGPDRDLYEVVPGHPDRKIGDEDIVQIHDGKRFFTAPSHINPGTPV
jgi:multiubiquitin